MREIDKALADILEIRNQIAAGTSFRGYGPVAIAITALLALAMATAQAFLPIAPTAAAFIYEWMAVAVVCGTVIRIEMQGRSLRLHSSLADAMIHQAIEQFLPAFAACFFLPVLFLRFIPESVWMVPGLWQILASIALFASLRTLPKPIALVGAWYFVTGFGCLLLASRTHTLSPWLMGLPFIGGQALMAAILYYRFGDSDGED